MGATSILLTGGAGLIGSATLRLLNQLGHTNILVVDKLGSSPWKWKNLRDAQFADYIEYDDLDVWKLPQSITTVIHIGARSYTTEQNAAFLMRNNYQFTMKLAGWAASNSRRFVYASSAATYGADEAMDDTAPIDGLKPLNAYAFSKQMADLTLEREGYFKYSAVGLKYFNVFGPPWERHKGEQASLVLKAYDSLRAGKPIELFESARKDIPTDQIARDFLAVDDAAKVTVWAALDPVGRKTAGLFNVGSGVASSFDNLARFTAEAYVAAYGDPQIKQWETMRRMHDGSHVCCGKEFDMSFPFVERVPMPEQLRSRYQYHTCAPISKLRAAGYTEEFTPLDEAVKRYMGALAKEEGGQ